MPETETESDATQEEEGVAEEPEATEEEATETVEQPAPPGDEAVGDGPAEAAEDAVDIDELATLVAAKIKGDQGNGSDEDELMAKVRRVIKEEKESDHAEDRIADKVAAKVGSRAPDPPPAPEYKRLAKLLFGKRG